MSEAMQDVGISEPALQRFFEQASAYLIGQRTDVGLHAEGSIETRWIAHQAMEEAVAAVRRRDAARAIELAERLAGNALLYVLGLMSGSGDPAIMGYARKHVEDEPRLVNVPYAGGRTLLHEAAGNGNLDMVELLLRLGANPNSDGHSPLYFTGNQCDAKTGSAIVRALVAAGAEVDARDKLQGCTALHMAARRGHVLVAEALLDCGANIEARDKSGDTPLRRAVNCGKPEVAALLLARGANRNSVGSRGLTPVSAARGAPMKRLLAKSELARSSRCLLSMRF